MKKRIASVIFVIALIINLFPVNTITKVMAEETGAAYLASYCEAVLTDGNLSEKEWLMYGRTIANDQSAKGKFDALWDKSQTLYLGIQQEDAKEVNVLINNQTVNIDLNSLAVTGSISDKIECVIGNAVEIKIPFSAFQFQLISYSDTVPFSINLISDSGDYAYSGNLGFVPMERKLANLLLKDFGLKSKNDTQTAYEETEGGIHLYDKYTESGPNAPSKRAYLAKTNVTPYSEKDKIIWTEFDFSADSMPVEGTAATLPNWSNYGLSFSFTNSKNEALCAAISNTADGIQFFAGTQHSQKYHVLNTGKKVGEKFHFALAWQPDGKAEVYVDGLRIGTIDGMLIKAKEEGWGTPNMLMFNLRRNSTPPSSSADDIDFTITNIAVGNSGSMNLTDYLVWNLIAGSNVQQNNVTSDLNLVSDVSDGKLNPVEIEWTSSMPEAISSTGKVTQSAEPQKVTLTATLKSNPSVQKTFDVVVAPLVIHATLTNEPFVVDGILDENAYMQYKGFSVGNDPGSTVYDCVSAIWDKDNLYLGVKHNGAKSVKVSIAEHIIDLDLATKQATENTLGGASWGVQGDAAEFRIPLKDIGISADDYDKSIKNVQIILTMPDNTVRQLEKVNLDIILTGVAAHPVTGFAGSGASISGRNITYHVTDSGLKYSYKTKIQEVNHEKDILFAQDLQIDSLPEGTGAIINQTTAEGFYFWISDGKNTGTATSGPVVFCNLFNAGNDELSLRVSNGSASSPNVVKLGKKVGDAFRLITVWGSDDSLSVFIDGEIKGIVENATYTAAGLGEKCIQFRCNNIAGAEITTSNHSIAILEYSSIKEEITKEAVLGTAVYDNVTEDITLLDVYRSPYLGEISLTWESSDPDTIGTDGTVTRPDAKVSRAVRLTASASGMVLFSVDCTVAPLKEADLSSPSIINTAYTAEEITIDGSIAEEGWILSTLILNGEKEEAGRFGAQWDNSNLYLAVDPGSATTLGLSVNNNLIEMDTDNLTLKAGSFAAFTVKKNNVIEFCFPLENLGIEANRYNIMIPVTVALDTDSYTGTLKLTSVDWFATDNKEHRLPILLKGSAGLGPDKPTAKQGSKQIVDGWNMYNLYDPDGSNPTEIRTYTIFMGKPIYQPFADRTKSTYVEFDFQADSMPVYAKNTAVGWNGSYYACYGFTWALADAYPSATEKVSNVVLCGIFNSEDGLMFVCGNDTIPLNKEVGDKFRISELWDTEGNVRLYLDGSEYHVFQNVEKKVSALADRAMSMNMVRSKEAAKSKNDDINIRITNLAMGKFLGDSLLDSLTFDVIKADNEGQYAVTGNLALIHEVSNSQLSTPQNITWTSSDPDILSSEGVVTRPQNSGKLVTLTAQLENGEQKALELYVMGLAKDMDVLVALQDYNPKNGQGIQKDIYNFSLDTDNNSIITDLRSSQSINVVALQDSDSVARLNENVLTLWISDDNKTYHQIRDFKLLQSGNTWYLYDFEAQCRYVKVHCTYYDSAESSFSGVLSEMIRAYKEQVFGDNGAVFGKTSTYQLQNNSGENRTDYAWRIPLADAVVESSENNKDIRVFNGKELLYHYVDGTDLVVRIPYLKKDKTVALTILSGNSQALDISNKENVYEVSYGTKEAFVLEHSRWLCTLDNGTVISIVSEDGKMNRTFSYDGGHTWTKPDVLDCTEGFMTDGGGFIYNRHTGRLIYQGYLYNKFVAGDMTQSDCKTTLIYSDDNGVTWNRLGFLQTDKKYVLSYTPGLELSTYDGPGPNVDYVFPCGVQYNNNGAFCCQVAYSKDGGDTWMLGPDEIVYGNETAFEGGVSEATIAEREDGSLILFARCQSADVDNFAVTFSNDHGLTWNKSASLSSIYTVNTQPYLYKYGEDNLMIWGGNNVLGGNSYQRFPLNVAVADNTMQNFRNIQDLYLKYSLQGLTAATRNQITNQSVAAFGDSLLVSWGNNFTNTLLMRVDDFQNYFYKTKGAFDSFEHGTAKYEGWAVTKGKVKVSSEQSTDGNHSMKFSEYEAAARSIPYLQDGKVAFNLYVEKEAPEFSVELQSAYSDVYGKCSPVSFKIGGDSGTNNELNFKKGWNQVLFDIQLTKGNASVSINGEPPVSLTVQGQIGDYITFINIETYKGTTIYLDELLVESETDMSVQQQGRTTVTVSSNPAGAASVSGAGTYAVGETITLTTSASAGYTFLGWYLDGNDEVLSESPVYRVTVTEDTEAELNYIAKYKVSEKKKFSLIVGNGTVNYSYQEGTQTGTWSNDLINNAFPLGTTFALTAVPNDGYTFLYWMDSEGRIISESTGYRFCLGDDVRLQACYSRKTEKQYYVVFRDVSGKVIWAGNAVQNQADGTSSVEIPSHGIFEGHTFTGWRDASGNILTTEETGEIQVTEGMVIYASYERTGGFTVTINGELQPDTYSYGSLVTVETDEIKDDRHFSGWYKGDGFVSDNTKYSFYITENTSLTAKYEGAEVLAKQPVVHLTMNNRVDLGNGKQKAGMTVSWSVPEGYTFIEAGVIRTLAEDYSDRLTLAGVDGINVKKSASKLTSPEGTYAYTLTLGTASANKKVYAAGYMICKNNTTNQITTLYSQKQISIPIE